MRSTSIRAYREIRDNGLLSKRRFEVYDHLFHHGPSTARETSKILSKRFGTSEDSYNSRFIELERQGVIKPVGEVENPHSGMKVTQWDVTANLPTKFESTKAIPRKRLLLMREVLREVYKHPDTSESVRDYIKSRLN